MSPRLIHASALAVLALWSTLCQAETDIAQQTLWKGTFDGWTFGYKSKPFDRNLYWQILDNGDLQAIGGDSYNTQSGMRSNAKFENYELTLEYKWLTPGNTPKTGNSGIWLHGQEGFHRAGGAFPNSIEVQLRKTSAGDLLRKGLEIDGEPGFASEGEAVFQRTPKRSNEHFHNQWNALKIMCKGAEITVWLNGVLVNKAINCRLKNGPPVTSGYITLQAEIGTLVFRNILIHPIK